MKISEDYMLLNVVLEHKEELYLHNDTIELLEGISSIVKKQPDKSFRTKIITNKIIEVWVLILQDSIYNLKCFDSRENAYISKKLTWREENSDLNNQFVFGLDRLKKYFKEFTDFESVLYGIDGNYRDHVIHVFRVWLLGIALLYTKDNDLTMGINDLEFEHLIPGKPIVRKEEVFSMWAIIALCHDLGYPLEKAEKINDSVEKMYRHLGKINIQKFSAAFQLEHQFLNKFLLDFISSKIEICSDIEVENKFKEKYDAYLDGSLDKKEVEQIYINSKKIYRTSIQTKYYIKFAKSLEYYSHGIISSTILLKSLFYFLESDFNIQERTMLSFEDARQFYIRKEILRSIASHTCPEVYHLKANTLPFLLILCDELQEWGRPRFDDIKSIKENTSSNFEVEIVEFKRESIKFIAKYALVNEPEELAIKTFKRWHEILRSAVYDDKRKFTLEITLEIESNKYVFEFSNNNLNTNKKTNNKMVKFDIYDLGIEKK